MIKKRILPESNYSAIYVDGATVRIPIDWREEITELAWPEFYDVSFGTRCNSCACSAFCYTSATHKGGNYKNLVERIHSFFGPMTENQRPFQIAAGGGGEPTIHPEFIQAIKAFADLGIIPNYTTNGIHLSEEVLDATVEYCGGIAISLHEGNERFWRKSIDLVIKRGIKTNLHFIVSDEASVFRLHHLYHEFRDAVDYFVLLPQVPVGFASGENRVEVRYDLLAMWLENTYQNSDIAFGSQAYRFLLEHPEYQVSIYPPEIMSKYILLDGDVPSMYNNSFDMIPVPYSIKEGCKIGVAGSRLSAI